ncbi:hypothetical protein CHX27_11855 [Flavobacterium aurantiibacter]|uniref:Uncharacterized protein n=1 Tax=Flavobacterium aurantiibacter TaxID=2023067 RepID=A0A255ZNN4_9FLAO|nr:hypothetical protein CHX27_11855 [Flavobacterium aurantiibacter]
MLIRLHILKSVTSQFKVEYNVLPLAAVGDFRAQIVNKSQKLMRGRMFNKPLHQSLTQRPVSCCQFYPIIL